MREPLDCAYVQQRLNQFLDGELTEREADELRLHIDACEHCLDETDMIVLVRRLVRRSCSDQHAPASLRMRIVSQLQQITITRVEFRGEAG